MGGLQQFILHEESASYWRVVFENPPLNLVNPDTLVQLRQLVGRIETAPELKVVLFESTHPDFFLAHYDMARATEKVAAEGAVESPWIDFATRLVHAPVISIAAVRGRARGIGNEFLMACDLRFASIERAIFGQPEIGVGRGIGTSAFTRGTFPCTRDYSRRGRPRRYDSRTLWFSESCRSGCRTGRGCL
jgi:enoyl-CoA hydratase/carnithine racemase